MITSSNIVSISQMRKDTESVMKKIAGTEHPLYLFSRSKIKAVIVNPEKFAEMQEMIEDYLDAQELLTVDNDELVKAEDWQKTKAKIGKK